jgi:hypothetical protein
VPRSRRTRSRARSTASGSRFRSGAIGPGTAR